MPWILFGNGSYNSTHSSPQLEVGVIYQLPAQAALHSRKDPTVEVMGRPQSWSGSSDEEEILVRSGN
jgi:hypothetical protein